MKTKNVRKRQALRYMRYMTRHQYRSDAIFPQPNCLHWMTRNVNRSKQHKAFLRKMAQEVNHRWTPEKIAQQVRLAMALHWARQDQAKEPSVYHQMRVRMILEEIVDLQSDLLHEQIEHENTTGEDIEVPLITPPSLVKSGRVYEDAELPGGDTGDATRPDLRLV